MIVIFVTFTTSIILIVFIIEYKFTCLYVSSESREPNGESEMCCGQPFESVNRDENREKSDSDFVTSQ